MIESRTDLAGGSTSKHRALTANTLRLETSRHLYQPPRYVNPEGEWHDTLVDALLSSKSRAWHWDEAAILSLVSLGYICDNRTLIKGITRQPWLSSIDDKGQCHLEGIPEHGTLAIHPRSIAKELARRLEMEARSVADTRRKLFILLSGGLDSRVVAGVFSSLHDQGVLKERPVAVTWGAPDSRDVVYAALVAAELGWEVVHLDLTPQDLLRNIDAAALALDAAVSPVHLHRMTWFRNVPRDAIVVNGSYGDSVGRAEFSGRHVLELKPLTPSDPWRLIVPSVAPAAQKGLADDLAELRRRVGRRPGFAVCECEMQAHYMRGMIAHAMSIINSYCPVYHMFTDPGVYSFMWSVHPSFRGNSAYAELLELLNPALARIPWARTNRALRGRTSGARGDLSSRYADYDTWLRTDLNVEIRKLIDVGEMSRWGLFDKHSLEGFVKSSTAGIPEYRYDVLAWLASLRKFRVRIEGLGVEIEPNVCSSAQITGDAPLPQMKGPPCWRIKLRNVAWIHQVVRRCRVAALKAMSLLANPPRPTRRHDAELPVRVSRQGRLGR